MGNYEVHYAVGPATVLQWMTMRFANLPLALVLGFPVCAQMPDTPLRSVIDPGVVTTRQGITPAGVQSIFTGRVQSAVFGANSSEVWVLNFGTVLQMDWRANRVIAKTPVPAGGVQGLRFDAGSNGVLVTGAQTRQVKLVRVAGGAAVTVADNLGRNVVGSPGLAAKAPVAVVPLTGDSKAVVIDTKSGKVTQPLATGIAPFGAVVNSVGTVAYVSNWGGRPPREGDVTAVTGYARDADKVVVDTRGIASTGTVRRFDLANGQMVHEIATGLHPTAMVWDEPRARLYVANGNQDSVTVIDTAGDKVLRTITIQPFAERVAGIAPTALAISADGETLYAACGGINAVAVIKTRMGTLAGSIPTAWYPNGVALSPDGKYLAVSTLLGVGSGSRDDPKRRYVHAVRGSIAVVELPDAVQLAAYTSAVAENNRMSPATRETVVARQPDVTVNAAPAAIPARRGAPSLIEHVVFVIKENRSYDQVFGDIAKGNSDPSLVMFGADVTPNQHKLADQFVLLDNFYASGGNSADGHQWVTQANETDYVMWPAYTNRSYPFDGSDPIAYSSGGFLWDAALKSHKTVRVFGEFAGVERDPRNNRAAMLDAWNAGQPPTRQWNTVAPIAPLNKILVAGYPAYTLEIPDVVRAQVFLGELKKWTDSAAMPNLTFVQLPSNHTHGTDPGANTAKAMVADNDLALGQIVEGLTKSPFWKKMAIFVVEDDAQNGVDHVDGHRTVSLVVSPYARRGAIDSTFYSHNSILKTIELILGLPNLSLFDRIATDMRPSFQNTPDLTPFSAEIPRQSLFERNPAKAALHGKARADAIASSKMRWDIPDAVPSDKLNRILWRQIRGEKTPYPGVRRSVFSPFAIDVDEDDDDDDRRKK